jgi:hypothetical protein
MNPTFLSVVDTVLGECRLVCHIGDAETTRNLPVSYFTSTTSNSSSNILPNIDNSNRWVLLIDALYQIKGFENVVDYNERHQKFVVGMKCKQ